MSWCSLNRKKLPAGRISKYLPANNKKIFTFNPYIRLSLQRVCRVLNYSLTGLSLTGGCMKFNFTEEGLNAIFPFYVLVDEELTIKSFGTSIGKLLPELLGNHGSCRENHSVQ